MECRTLVSNLLAPLQFGIAYAGENTSTEFHHVVSNKVADTRREQFKLVYLVGFPYVERPL